MCSGLCPADNQNMVFCIPLKNVCYFKPLLPRRKYGVRGKYRGGEHSVKGRSCGERFGANGLDAFAAVLGKALNAEK